TLIIIFTSQVATEKKVKNVIIMIPDGMSVGATTLARWYNGGNLLAMDELACGLVRTYNSDTPIGDSAPAGSAFATGFKSSTGNIASFAGKNGMPGVPDIEKGKEFSPLATVLESARVNGRSVGIVSTCETSHATPADFSSHNPSRKEMDKLAEQQSYNLIDVIMGGGSNYFKSSKRGDGEDLIKVMKDQGYDYVTTKDELLNSKANKLLGLFADGPMCYDFDRVSTKEPSLSEMTSKAIEVLNRNKNGFFLMVEGSEVDWAAHANDPIGIIGDILAFDQAVKVALDFAKKDKNTVVIVLTDHGNSGITMGNKATSLDYDKRKLEEFINPLKKAKLTAEGIEKLVKEDMTIDQIKTLIADNYGISDLTDKETEEVAKYFEMKKAKDPKKPAGLNNVLGPMIANRALIGFTTNGHTGEDVVLYMYSPNNERLTGLVENTEIARYMEKVLTLDLTKTTSDFFNKVETKKQEEATSKFNETYKKKVLSVVDGQTGLKNPALIIVQSDGNVIIFPENKNYATDSDGKILKTFKSVTVYNGNDWFVSKDAITFIK
ncbi:MAG TPA: alkaline phosphatase, partial [Spirochaetota bacterium]|nr:alkaline phosphatase [Spirochaetota bacterium]